MASVNSRDNVERITRNAIHRNTWVKLPDRWSCFHRCDVCDSGHEISDCKINNVGQARQALCIAVEGVNVFAKENVLNCTARSVIVASIVGSDTEKLARKGWIIWKQRELHWTYLSWPTCYNSSTFCNGHIFYLFILSYRVRLSYLITVLVLSLFFIYGCGLVSS